jgi:trehalose synthase-fused probable maltokinase
LSEGAARSLVEGVLPPFVARQRWFRSKSLRILGCVVLDLIPLSTSGSTDEPCLVVLGVDLEGGSRENYVFAAKFAAGAADERTLIAAERAGESGVLADAAEDPRVAAFLLELVAAGGSSRGGSWVIRGSSAGAAASARLAESPVRALAVRPVGVEQSNTSYIYADRFIAKVVRKVEAGESTELELLRELGSARPGVAAPRVPELVGHVELRQDGAALPASTLVVVQTFSRNRGDAWSYVGEEVQAFFARVLAAPAVAAPVAQTALAWRGQPVEPEVAQLLGDFPRIARRLGQRTAELHAKLAAAEAPEFVPEAWSKPALTALVDAVRGLAADKFAQARRRLDALPANARSLAEQIITREADATSRLSLGDSLSGLRTRIHGDYHLGQVLVTDGADGADFVIIDFEGEPARPIEQRREKRSPIVDVAGMLRSFHYAAVFGLVSDSSPIPREDVPRLEPWARVWNGRIGAAFLEGYLDAAERAAHVPAWLPTSPAELARLLGVHLLEKSLYEVGYELDNRPTWATIPLTGVLDVLESMERAD